MDERFRGFKGFRGFRGFRGEGIAFGDEFYMPLTRPPSTAIAVPLPHRWGRQVRYGIGTCVTIAA